VSMEVLKDSGDFFEQLEVDGSFINKNFFDCLNCSYAYFDLSGALKFVSKKNLRPFVIKSGLLNVEQSWEDIWSNEFKSVALKAFEKAKGGETCSFSVYNGSIKEAHQKYKIVLSPHLNKKKESLGVLGIAFDSELVPKLPQSLSSELNDFVYSVVHDLKAPVRHTASFVEILKLELGENTSAEVQECLKSIIFANESMKVLIEGLLVIARNTTTDLPFVSFEAKTVSDNILTLFKKELDENNFTVENKIDVLVNYDQELLSKVMQNLVDNAIKYSKPGKSNLLLDNYIDSDGEVVFLVKDDGVGISKSFRPLVFKAFQSVRLKESGLKDNSSGIGLAICKRIIDGNHGKIWFESTENEGSTFFFKLYSSTK